MRFRGEVGKFRGESRETEKGKGGVDEHYKTNHVVETGPLGIVDAGPHEKARAI